MKSRGKHYDWGETWLSKWVIEWVSECPAKTQGFPLLQELVNHIGQYEQRQEEWLGASAGVVAQEAVTEAHLARSNDSLGLHAALLVSLVGAPTLRVAHAHCGRMGERVKRWIMGGTQRTSTVHRREELELNALSKWLKDKRQNRWFGHMIRKHQQSFHCDMQRFTLLEAICGLYKHLQEETA